MQPASETKPHFVPSCVHCRTDIPYAEAVIFDQKKRPFCCAGCRAVYSAIEAYDLSDYYSIRDQFLKPEDLRAVSESVSEFAYLDASDVQKEFLTENNEMYFHIAGIQCAACVWILEKIPEITSEVVSVRVDAVKGLAVVRAQENRFSAFASKASELGYVAHPINQKDSWQWLNDKSKKEELRRIAVTAVCAGNIMLLAAAVYFGADPAFTALFNGVSLALAIPVMVYGARPLFRGAWGAWRAKTASLDLPIAVAVGGGFLLSLVNVIRGNEHIYLDSITVLVLLILSSRYFIHRLQDRFFSFDLETHSLLPVHAYKKNMVAGVAGPRLTLAVTNLKHGDVIHVLKGEKIPADGTVLEGSAWVRESLLTGEALPRVLAAGSEVFAGTTLESGEILVRVKAAGLFSRIGLLQKNATQTALVKNDGDRSLEKWTERFTWGVIGVGLITLFYFIAIGEAWVGFERMLALYIVACPCALAFGVPLVYSKGLLLAAARGVFVRTADTFLKFLNTKHVIFDKTGTLTLGQLSLLDESDALNFQDRSAVFHIQSQVAHPVARAMAAAYAGQVQATATVEDLELLPGRGVRAKVGGHNYEILTSDSQKNIESKSLVKSLVIWVDVNKDGKKIATIGFSDHLRTETLSVARQLREAGAELWILSGDKKANVHLVSQYMGVDAAHARAEQKPEDKEAFVAGLQNTQNNTVMIGDGINDAGAMAKADVGIIVGGAMERALMVADVFLTAEGIRFVPELWQWARKIQKGFRRVRLFSVTYNILTGGLAVAGFIHPLAAALLMPLSSIVVLSISYLSVRNGTQTWT